MKRLFLEHPLTQIRAMDIDIPELTDEMYIFIVNNFFQPLNINRIDETNLHHIFDAIISFRACYWGFGFYELVDEMNVLLDVLAPYLGEISDEARYRYRLQHYRNPNTNEFNEETSKRVINDNKKEIASLSTASLISQKEQKTAQKPQYLQNNINTHRYLNKKHTQSLKKTQNKLNSQSTNTQKTSAENKKFKNADFIASEVLEMIRK